MNVSHTEAYVNLYLLEDMQALIDFFGTRLSEQVDVQIGCGAHDRQLIATTCAQQPKPL